MIAVLVEVRYSATSEKVLINIKVAGILTTVWGQDGVRSISHDLRPSTVHLNWLTASQHLSCCRVDCWNITNTSRVRTILALGYWVLGNIHRYWIVLLLGDIFGCSDTQYNTNQTAVSPVHNPHASEQLLSSAFDLYSDRHNHLSGHHVDMLLFIKHNHCHRHRVFGFFVVIAMLYTSIGIGIGYWYH